MRCISLVTGLNINAKKCNLLGIGVSETDVASMAKFLNCKEGSLPFEYLGIPIGSNMKRACNWNPVIDRFAKKLATWKAKSLSFAGRVTLAKSVLGSLPSYYLSLFKAPVGVLKKLEKIRRDFVWGKSGESHKMRWVRWDKLTRAKDKGGLGIGRIRDFNVAMIVKWWWRMREDPDHLWAKVVSSIHGSRLNKKLIPVNNSIPGVWKDIGSVDEILRKTGIGIADKLKVTVGNGAKTRFWKDVWLSQTALCDEFPDIFRLAKNKEVSVAECFAGHNSNRRWAWEWVRDPESKVEWLHTGSLMIRLQQACLSEAQDRWKFENSEGTNFSVKDLRKILADRETDQDNDRPFMWNNWATLKANFLAWRATLM
ncbi:hypothetical protein HanRHA438_Chr14g0680971 [Helianthus annuus]|nr:hypothetical protein HanRHA438_Chr14g0680971 [Helianthus annuus]